MKSKFLTLLLIAGLLAQMALAPQAVVYAHEQHLALTPATAPIVDDLPGQIYFTKTRYPTESATDQVRLSLVLFGTLPADLPSVLQAWVANPDPDDEAGGNGSDAEPVLLEKSGERIYTSKDGLPLTSKVTPVDDGILTTQPGKLIYAIFWWTGQTPGSTGDIALVSGGKPSGKFSVQIDPSILTDPKTLPGEGEGEPPRPVAAIAAKNSPPVRMGEDQVIFQPRSVQEYTNFLTRYKGTVVQSREQENIGVVRVVLGALNAVDRNDFLVLCDWLGLEGTLIFSSEKLLSLYAVILNENFNGVRVTFNPILTLYGQPEGSEDAALQPFDEWWANEPTIGTDRAWVLSGLLDVEDSPINVAVIDGGFQHGGDVIEPLVDGHDYEDEDGDPFGDNPVSCSGDAPCPYHGDWVWGAAGAVVNNEANVAGAGGQVARPMFYRIGYGAWLFDMEDIFHRAVDHGADVINMSAGMPCELGGIHYCNPAVRGGLCTAAFLALPIIMGLLPLTPGITLGMGLFTVALGVFCFNAFNPESALAHAAAYAAAHDTVVVAAAGNTVGIGSATYGPYDVADVAVVPCTVPNVICVGEMASDFTLRNNWGDAVDIWGPSGLPRSNDVTHTLGGTSGTTGFISGVVALLKAVNRDLTPDEIRDILRDSGHASPVEPLIHHYVDVQAALLAAAATLPERDADVIEINGFCPSYGWDEVGAGNDTDATATTVAAGAGDIGPIDDAALHTFGDAEDWYQMSLPADSTGRFYHVDEVFNYASRVGRIEWEGYVLLGSELEDTSARNLWPTTFYLRTTFDTPADDTCYSLQGEVEAHILLADRFEINNSLADATPLTGWTTLGDNAYQLDVANLTIHTPDDLDFFSVERPSGAAAPTIPPCPMDVEIGGFYLRLDTPVSSSPIWIRALYDEDGEDQSTGPYMNSVTPGYWSINGFSLRVEGDEIEAAPDGYGLHVEYSLPEARDYSAMCAVWEDIELIILADMLTHGTAWFIPDSPDATQMLMYPFNLPCDPRVCDPSMTLASDFLLFHREGADVLNLVATLPATSQLRLQLLNSEGAVLGEAMPPPGAQAAAETQTLVLNIPNLPAGVFLIKVTGEEWGVNYTMQVSGTPPTRIYLPTVVTAND